MPGELCVYCMEKKMVNSMLYNVKYKYVISKSSEMILKDSC